MSDREFEKKIGEAWRLHYNGEYALAIEQFSKLVEQMSDNIDALWGLGLACRASGDRDRALELFRRAKDLVAAQFAEHPEEYGRLHLLNRMIQQQVDLNSDFIN